jgi:hypothetical protein
LASLLSAFVSDVTFSSASSVISFSLARSVSA